MIFRSLKTKILLSVIIVVLVIEGVFLYLNILSFSRQILDKTEEEAFNLSETIRLSIRNAMIKDRRDEFQRIIDDVALRKGIAEVRFFNKQGEITVSSDKTKVGTVVDKKAEACYGCHREDEAKVLLPSDSKTRIYHTEKQSLLGLINPIYNEASCYPCHPKTTNVLGVLDITISLEGFKKQKAQIYNHMIISGVVSVIILSLLSSLLLTRFVNRPIDKLLAATKTVAHGNLDQTVGIRSHDELGELSNSFNNMISELKRRTQEFQKKTDQLARSNKELEQFAYVASHDLREPLRMVTSYVKLLARRYKDKLDADADDFITFAVDGATRMQRLIDGLLIYSRVGTRVKEFEPTDCEMILGQCLSNLQVAIGERGAVITHDPLPTVMADHLQLTQLFQNLIDNAIKFRRGEEPPRIHISAKPIAESGIRNAELNSELKDGWVFSVHDNGIGIAPEYADRIFVIFQRLHDREKYPGTGIGLAVCKKIVERHGGSIWVESEPGKGATFYFTIPAKGDQQP